MLAPPSNRRPCATRVGPMHTGSLTMEIPAELVVPPPVLDVVVPVHNEEVALERCLRRLHGHLTDSFPYSFRITVAENASTDATVTVARRGGGRAVWHRGGGGAPARSRPGAADSVVGLRRPSVGLHGRRPGHRPRRAAAAG